MNNYKFILILLLAVIFSTGNIFARKNGINGLTSTKAQGCFCHNITASEETVLSITSSTGSFTVEPGSTTKFTITVNHPTLLAAGIDIAVGITSEDDEHIGTLSPITGEGLNILGEELVHSAPKDLQNGSVSFSFNWTAPLEEGIYNLRAVGNAVNKNNKSDNADKWNYMLPQSINVKGPNSITDNFLTKVVFPNPFSDFTVFNLSDFNQGSIQRISIADVKGNEILSIPVSSKIFKWNGKDANGKNVAAGIYYLIIQLRNERRIIPLISL
ncbi:MAG: hypothetical protein A2X64_01325 [Ignavibacteria bacterium GWF2_33_9]|nr:MAG: hypothetical protein A2X64_01325 [Ignavibacteria bacterium GWF2_33_9]